MSMLDIGSRLPTQAFPDQTRSATPASAPGKSAIKTGTIIVLSPTALKLSRDLQAVQTDPDQTPDARLAAADQLRQLALKVFSGD